MTQHTNAMPPEDEFEMETETVEEAAAEAPVSSVASSNPPEGLSEEEQNVWWMKNVYRGNQERQLTVRAFVASALIGALMAVSNLYVGLKSGWGLGVTITAAVIAFAVFKTLETVTAAVRKNAMQPLSMLENCTILSSASAAGSISSAGLVSAIPALYLITGDHMTAGQMMAWLACVATLGLAMAVPLKRQLINIDRLAFPSGTATAETLRSLHSTGAKAMQQAKTLLWCGLVGVVVKFFMEGWKPLLIWLWQKNPWHGYKTLAMLALPDSCPLWPGKTASYWLNRYAIGFEPSTIFIAAGAIMGIRVGISMLLGMIVFFGVLGPTLDHYGMLFYSPQQGAFRSVVTWTLWPSVALMVTAGLTNFALRWRLIVRAMGELTAIFGKRRDGKTPESVPESVEVPMSWFVLGVIVAGSACVILGLRLFGISWWMGVLAVLLTFVLSIVAARATGETDTTPIGAMGKMTQLTYALITPRTVPSRFISTNLMTAAITSGASCHSADLLQSLKTGYLVGANAKKQAIAQFFGIFVGLLVCVPVYCIIVRTPHLDVAAAAKLAKEKPPTEAKSREEMDTDTLAESINKEFAESSAKLKAANEKTTNLLTAEYAAPSVTVWKGVAELLAKGLDNLPKGSMLAMLLGGIIGVIIAILEEFLPRKYVKWVPSATGFGLAGVIMPQNSISMFLGALLAWFWMKKSPKSCDDYMISGASGLIAGESLTGVGINLLVAGPAVLAAVWRGMFGG
jgi:OPT family oligopeptide transporter